MPLHNTTQRNLLRTGIPIVLLIAAVACVVQGAASSPAPEENHPLIETPSEQPAQKYVTKEIQHIRPIADRVLADNPETPGQAPGDFGEVDPPNWRLYEFEVPKPDGGFLRMTLARPQSWLDDQLQNESGEVFLEFEELGIAHWGQLLATHPCPDPGPGNGRLVTGTFNHSAGNVIDLHFEGLDEPIGTTANHPFWSVDRRKFVQAGSLKPGEQLRRHDGASATLIAADAMLGEVPVYNLEVDGEHVYHVGTKGILVHNAKKYDLVTVYHFTDAKGMKAITAGRNIRIKASRPPGGNPKGAYFSTEGPNQLKNLTASKLRISKDKTQYVIEAQVPRHLLRQKNGNHRRIVFSPEDIDVPDGQWKVFENPFFN